MKTYFTDIISSIQKFSQKLDNLTLLTNQHWVAIDDINNSKVIYIFRANNELLISQNGIVEKAKWEYLGNNSLLIDKKADSFLFKHGFFDENILALKIDNHNEYAFLINENKFEGELNSVEKVIEFLKKKYIEPDIINPIIDSSGLNIGVNRLESRNKFHSVWKNTDKGDIEIKSILDNGYTYGDLVYLNGEPAPDGKYIYSRPAWLGGYVIVKDGKLIDY